MKTHSKSLFRILVINPGSTSTKVAVFENKHCVFNEYITHSEEALSHFKKISDQKTFRYRIVENILNEKQIGLDSIHAVVGRGGLLRPVEGGTYTISPSMLEDLSSEKYGSHPCNLGGLIAHEFGINADIPSFIVDPVVVDEMEPISRITGMPEIERKSIFHALNQKAVARDVASEIGKEYQDVNFIVAHMGGGISVGVHQSGRVVDVNNALDGEGPMAPERAGSLPAGQLVDLCCSKKYSQSEMHKKLVGEAGLVAHAGTNDMRQLLEMMRLGDRKAELLFRAMAFQISKSISALASVVKGKVDGIILTGGLANNEELTDRIRSRVEWIAPVHLRPGEMEMEALACGALRILLNEEQSKIY